MGWGLWIAYAPPIAPVINLAGNKLFALKQGSSSIVQCKYDSATGNISGCSQTGFIMSSQSPYGMAINDEGSFLFIVNRSIQGITRCAINSATGALTNCGNAAPGLKINANYIAIAS